MRSVLGTVVLIVMLIASCKKKDKETASPNSTSLPDGSTSNATTYSGIMQAFKSYQLTLADTLDGWPYLVPHASFFSTPVGFLAGNSPIQVDSVFFNSVKLKYTGFSYDDTTFSAFSVPTTWRFAGSNPQIYSFTYANPNSIPGYSGYTSLPDSLKTGNAFVLNLTGLSGHSRVICSLADYSSTIFQKEFIGSSNSITVNYAPSETSQLSGTTGSIMVWVIKDDVRVFNGKNYDFTTELLISNSLVLY